ncbi:hypothetical protein [Pseudoalteromonas peptidolytica]|uniref:DUF2163 domain-containing protein n=1 Tax=Pseudoalteromonas peptidolytica F12-50-A1 TaxID=1315280 RepID=A0A8I0MYJ9_9GAMM|nr:hypothetical protein [Pseudoalteromonas peptidolytica]MBE0348290.1 hypothetical protein [Pseudoalteromonas peptidolytica F12-50-A1]NLR16574.1 hypothetical protein [Pseudoalteromonas peptidolytica]GEK08944.1 hypothetical protein PPE03_11930 [Pseudoalteromonas peptidolytica]
MLNLTSAQKALLAGEHSYANLLTIKLSSGFLRFTDAPHDIEFGAKYLSGIWIKCPSFQVDGKPKINEVNFKLSAVSPEVHAVFFNQSWLNRKVSVQRIFFNQEMTVQLALQLWEGLLINRDGSESINEASIELSAASIWADFKAARGRRTNEASQQLFFPNDKGFEFSGLVRKDIPWGKPTS